MVIVLDDCTTSIDAVRRKCPEFKDIFYKGRHLKITLIVSYHDNAVLNPSLRGGASIRIFADKNSALGCIDSDIKSPKQRKEIIEKVNATFNLVAPWQKLVFNRDNNTYYLYTAELHNQFYMCNPLVRDFAKKIESKSVIIESSVGTMIDNAILRPFGSK